MHNKIIQSVQIVSVNLISHIYPDLWKSHLCHNSVQMSDRPNAGVLTRLKLSLDWSVVECRLFLLGERVTFDIDKLVNELIALSGDWKLRTLELLCLAEWFRFSWVGVISICRFLFVPDWGDLLYDVIPVSGTDWKQERI